MINGHGYFFGEYIRNYVTLLNYQRDPYVHASWFLGNPNIDGSSCGGQVGISLRRKEKVLKWHWKAPSDLKKACIRLCSGASSVAIPLSCMNFWDPIGQLGACINITDRFFGALTVGYRGLLLHLISESGRHHLQHHLEHHHHPPLTLLWQPFMRTLEPG